MVTTVKFWASNDESLLKNVVLKRCLPVSTAVTGKMIVESIDPLSKEIAINLKGRLLSETVSVHNVRFDTYPVILVLKTAVPVSLYKLAISAYGFPEMEFKGR